jgi:enoyl-CoA hydratase/carnithine racemase
LDKKLNKENESLQQGGRLPQAHHRRDPRPRLRRRASSSPSAAISSSSRRGPGICLPEIKLRVIHRQRAAGPVRVTRRVGEGRAKEMIYFGDPIDASTALAWGLVNRVVPKGEALATAEALARELATRPNLALQASKQAIDLSFDVTEDEALDQTLTLSGQVFATNDCKEGVRAFFAKEKPRFTHS